MPEPRTLLYRILIVLLLAAHVFYMYGAARTMRESFGYDVTTTGIAAVFALFLLLPFVWAVAIADLPLIVSRHRARRRFRQGSCSACGYELRHSPTGVCSECGELRGEWPAYVMSWGTVRRYLLLNAAALILGVVTCESWLLWDEHQFRNEIMNVQSRNAAPAGPIARGRVAPFGNAAMLYHPDRGFSATD